jgi:hypothetical protein
LFKEFILGDKYMSQPKVYLILTASIHNTSGIQFPARRRSEYFLGLCNALNFCPSQIKPILVENSCENKSYLDVFNCDVVYTNDNSRLIEGDVVLHKGSREMIDIKKVIEKYDIQDNDIIIKLTARYQLFKPDFFVTVLENLEKDCIFRELNVCTSVVDDISIVQGLFAIRCKYLKQFEYRNHGVGSEQEFREFINDYIPADKILKVDTLWLRVCIGDNHKLVDC